MPFTFVIKNTSTGPGEEDTVLPMRSSVFWKEQCPCEKSALFFHDVKISVIVANLIEQALLRHLHVTPILEAKRLRLQAGGGEGLRGSEEHKAEGTSVGKTEVETIRVSLCSHDLPF